MIASLWHLIVILCLHGAAESLCTGSHHTDHHESQTAPHIIFVLADDLGWNDVGFHNPFVKTPNMDRLVRDGLEFTQYYTPPYCTPSRASFMTGRYPSNNGLYDHVILPLSNACLPFGQSTIAEQLKAAGYTTKMVGKWHLGNCDVSCLPTQRGFDEYQGSTGASVDYFQYTNLPGFVENFANNSISLEGLGTHIMLRHTAIARQMILDHQGKKNPLFLYLAAHAPQIPYKVTDDMLNRHPNLSLATSREAERRKYLGLVASLDDMIGNVTQALKDAHMYDNSIIVFASDNGGSSVPFGEQLNLSGNNYPLRGTKGSMFEGGVRVPAFVHSPLLPAAARGKKRDGLLHVTDWFPTFVSLAGAKKRSGPVPTGNLDGIDQAKFVMGESAHSRREEMLIYLTNFHLNDVCNDVDTAYRFGDWKLIHSKNLVVEGTDPENSDLWTKPAESPVSATIVGDDCRRLAADGSVVIRCLFNVKNDPSEQHNLYDQQPKVVSLLKDKINAYRKQRVASISKPNELKFLQERTTLLNGIRVLKPGYCHPEVDSPLTHYNKELCPLPSIA